MVKKTVKVVEIGGVKIEVNRWYRPMEIAQLRLILSSANTPQYKYILRLIHNGHLKAVNYAMGSKGLKYFKVLGSEIVRYKKEVERAK